MNHPFQRPRRLRQNASIRSLIEETFIRAEDFIVPLFICEGKNIKQEISSMPGYYRQSIDLTIEEVKYAYNHGFKAVLLFVKVEDELKDNAGTEALNEDGLMQKSIRAIKKACPEILVMSDVALDPYSSFGHDGIVKDLKILNDQTVNVLVEMAISHAQSGADFVAPSDMMDGRIGAIRHTLENSGFENTGIMAYSAKYASCFYGPFRAALDSAPGFGDKKTYQMNPANKSAALQEILLDESEGADIIMVKPALPYLDIIKMASDSTLLPIAGYQVSGEYAMMHAASKAGFLDLDSAIMETLISIKRAGANMIASYFWKDFLRITKY